LGGTGIVKVFWASEHGREGEKEKENKRERESDRKQ